MKSCCVLKIFCLLLFGMWCWSSLLGQSHLADVAYYGIDQGLSHRNVYDIHQDRRGFIWIGTQQGLNRFDGNTFQIYTKEKDGLASNVVHFILEDDGGKLWLFEADNWWYPTLPKQISIFDPQRDTILSIEDHFGDQMPFSLEDITGFLSNEEGQLLFETHRDTCFTYRSTDGFKVMLPKTKNHFRPMLYTPLQKIWGTTGLGASQVIIELDTSGQILGEHPIAETPGLSMIGIDEADRPLFYGLTDPLKLDLFRLDTRLPDLDTIRTFPDIVVGDWSAQIAYWPALQSFWHKQSTELLVFSPEQGILHDFGRSHPEIVNADPQRFYFDHQGSTWIGTATGLYRVVLNPNPFTQYLSLDYENYEISKAYSCRGIWASDDYLFVNTYKGRQRIQRASGQRTYLEPIALKLDNGEVFSISGLAFALFQDQKQQLWFSDHSLLQHDLENGEEQAYFVQSPDHYASNIWSIYEDENHQIWLGLEKGLSYLDTIDYEIKNVAIDSRFRAFTNSFVYAFVPSRNGHLWLATTSGLYRWKPKTGIQQRYWPNGPPGFNIPQSTIHHLHEDEAGILWLATGGGGLIRLQLDEQEKVLNIEQFTTTEGLSNDNLYAVYEDRQDQLWLSSDYGIIRFDKNSKRARAYLPKDGITHPEFNRISHFQEPNGKLLFGGLNGVTAFDPNTFDKDEEAYVIPLEVIAYQQYQAATDEVVDLTNQLILTKRIELAPGDRFQQLSFALLDYIDTKKINYRYKVLGLDERWTPLQQGNLRLGTLPYGSYQLVVQGQGADGRFSESILDLPIVVIRPLYARGWFQTLIVLLVIVLIIGVFRWRTRTLQRRQMMLEQVVAERTQTIAQQTEELRQLDQMKSRFFANVSHELRTPLTLILGPIGSVLKSEKLDKNHTWLLNTASKNGQSLLELINEILNLTKLESGKLALQENSVEFYPILYRLVAAFESFAAYKNIELELQYDAARDLSFDLDVEKFQKIINNLLSNAFKFTPATGRIELSVQRAENKMHLRVTDTGQGIHPQDLVHIFDRFYQSQRPDVATEGGTGIGLALCHEYAKLLGGRLWVESVLGQGSTFHLELPIKQESSNVSASPTTVIEEVNDTIAPFAPSPDHVRPNAPTILVVEDNYGLRDYIRLIVSHHYQVVCAEHGRAALDLLESGSCQPDLILSDIMMPVMDGFKLLTQLKSSDAWRHLPVIMLTARAGISDKLRALRIGVDDYLTKPFEEEELLARISNLLTHSARRNAWANELKETMTTSDVTSPLLSAADAEWLQKLESIVGEHQADSTLNVERLSELLFLSRRQLQRRIRLCTGLSPNQYIQEARMQTAKQLLENQSVASVKATAYSVGVRDVKYFSQQYRKRFGRLPSTYF